VSGSLPYLLGCLREPSFLFGRQIVGFVLVVNVNQEYHLRLRDVEVNYTQAAPFAHAAPHIRPAHFAQTATTGDDIASRGRFHQRVLKGPEVFVGHEVSTAYLRKACYLSERYPHFRAALLST
jgi:hypothetical protein